MVYVFFFFNLQLVMSVTHSAKYNCRNKIIYSFLIRVCSCKCSVGGKSASSLTVLFEFPLTWTLFLLFTVDTLYLCCGSGSLGSGSLGSVFLDLQDPDTYLFVRIRRIQILIRILSSSSKNSK